MQVFVSSVITGFEDYRAAAVRAIESLGEKPVTAEEFGARPDTPQQACLEAARRSDVTVLLLGERYGYKQASGLSATHEEFHEARNHRQVIAFVRSGVTPEPDQRAFIREVQEWAGGALTEDFSDPADLQAKVTRALHGHALRQATGLADPAEMHQRAAALVPGSSRRTVRDPALHIVVAGGPRHQVVRPAVLDAETLGQSLHQQAMFGPHRVLDPREGAEPRVLGTRLVVAQQHRVVELHEDGSVRVTAPAFESRDDRGISMPALVEEDIRAKVVNAIGYAAWVLSEVDPLNRLADVAVIAAITGSPSSEWRRRSAHAERSSSMAMAVGRPDVILVPASPTRQPRGALTAQVDGLAEDLVALLRRSFT